uniref:ATP synthase F0 subunit b n=1 Tax=Cyanophora biloba TaxID=1489483 RepID=A0A873WYP3_9EUKA|nr:ATP synthase F0 subunit b [Cyanophora biloba]QPB15020.1 ATP synthase F0 subunit b [Cyanophora biloba]
MNLKSLIYKLVSNFFIPVFIFSIFAKEIFVLQEEIIVLICFFIVLYYAIRVLNIPQEIKFNLETQRIKIIITVLYKLITIIYTKKQLTLLENNSSNYNKNLYSKIQLEDISLYMSNSLQSQFVESLINNEVHVQNKYNELVFKKKEKNLELIQQIIHNIYS